MKALLTIVALLCTIMAISQSLTDSLEQRLSSAQNDAERIDMYTELSWAYRSISPEKGIEHARKGLALTQTDDAHREEAIALLINIGTLHRRLGAYDSALFYLQQGIPDRYSRENRAKAFNNLGLVYMDKGEYEKAISHFIKAKELYMALGDRKGIAGCNVNIGIINYHSGKWDKALELYRESVDIYEEIGETRYQAIILNNMAVIYQDQGHYEEALNAYDSSFRKYEERGDDYGMATELGNLAVLYLKLERNQKALEVSLKSIEIREKINDQRGLSQAYNNLSAVYRHLNDTDKAFEAAFKGLEIAEELNTKDEIKSSLHQLAALYQEAGEFESAINYYRRYMDIKDSILNEQNNELISEMEAKYENESKSKQIELLEKQDALNKEKIAKQNLIEWGLVIGGVLLLCITILIYWKFAEGKKANQVIAHQKDIVEKQNVDILDSIKYAKRIQTAILPSRKLVNSYFDDSFVLYLPKDIVSGDFYWMEKVGDHLLFAVVDCTGHGVPGAFMSLVGYNAITQAVKFNNLTQPSEILDRMNGIVTDTLSRTHEDLSVRDGMDISLCSLHLKTNTLQFAGAFNPLFLISDGKLDVIKGDKKAVGPSIESRVSNFTHHELQLKPGDAVYITSDGFADQFGGARGKKFNTRRLRELLVDVSKRPVSQQHDTLLSTFMEWKGNEEQVDDVCVIGLKV